MKKDLKLRGWIVIALGFALAFIGARIHRATGIEFITVLSSGLLGGCVVLGVNWLCAGKNEQTQKRYEVECKDERSRAIRARAAYLTMWPVYILLFLFGIWLYSYIDVTAGSIALGIVLVGVFTFAIIEAVLKKRM